MITLLLTIMALASAALTISAESRGARSGVYIFKPLTMLLIIAIPVANGAWFSSYRYLIVVGLACSLVGDIFLMLPSDRFVAGLLSFLVAHLFYIVAFASGAFRVSSLWYALPLVLYGAGMVYFLNPHLGSMRTPVLIYVAVILVMAWLAVTRAAELRTTGSMLACAGALLFVASDSFLAVDRFRGRFPKAQLLVLSTYFAAQWLLALSASTG